MSEKPVNHLTPDGRKLVERLCELREVLNRNDPDGKELTHTEFTRQYLPFHESTWGRLREDTYTGNTVDMERRCRQAVIKLEREIAARGINTTGSVFHKTDVIRAVLEAVQKTLENSGSVDRLTVYLAATGGSKSILSREISRIHKGVTIEGRESWRNSYTAACRALAQAAGASKDEPMRNAAEAEECMLRYLSKRRMVICIDEANSFGPSTCNAIKLVLNQTPTCVFIAAVPALWAKMQQSSWFEASQLQRRALAVIQLDAITPGDVHPFIAGLIQDAQVLQAACKHVAEAATAFGLYDLVERVADNLRSEFVDGQAIGLESVRKAVAICRATYGRLPEEKRGR